MLEEFVIVSKFNMEQPHGREGCAKKVIEILGLSFIELQTKMLEIELIPNSPPLCEIYENGTEEVLN